MERRLWASGEGGAVRRLTTSMHGGTRFGHPTEAFMASLYPETAFSVSAISALWVSTVMMLGPSGRSSESN